MSPHEHPEVLSLDRLDQRHPGLTKALAESYFEAASICLARHHNSPVTFTVDCDKRIGIRAAQFRSPDARMIAAYANTIDATEDGAYAVSLAAVELETQLVTISRAETLTGADWYLAPLGDDPVDLEGCYRLEVSGTDRGDRRVIQARLQEKIAQTHRGRSNLPAIASVVGFKALEVVIARIEATP